MDYKKLAIRAYPYFYKPHTNLPNKIEALRRKITTTERIGCSLSSVLGNYACSNRLRKHHTKLEQLRKEQIEEEKEIPKMGESASLVSSRLSSLEACFMAGAYWKPPNLCWNTPFLTFRMTRKPFIHRFVHLGRFRLSINARMWASGSGLGSKITGRDILRLDRLQEGTNSPTVLSCAYPHPHASQTGSICLGDLGDVLHESLNTRWILPLFLSAQAMVVTYERHGPYKRLEEWGYTLRRCGHCRAVELVRTGSLPDNPPMCGAGTTLCMSCGIERSLSHGMDCQICSRTCSFCVADSYASQECDGCHKKMCTVCYLRIGNVDPLCPICEEMYYAPNAETAMEQSNLQSKSLDAAMLFSRQE